MRRVDFNSLPSATRQRFIEAISGTAWNAGGPIFRRVGASGAIAGWIILLLFCAGSVLLLTIASWGSTYYPVQPISMVPYYATLFFLASLSVVGLVRRGIVSRALPFAPGVYVFPLDLVAAESKDLEIFPLSELLSLQPVHHYRNGIYSGTVFNFTFPGRTFSLRVYGRDFAEHSLNQLRAGQHAIGEAVERGDVHMLTMLDPFCHARMSDWASVQEMGPVASALPSWLRLGWAFALGAGIVLALPTWAIRNWRSDEAAFARARATSEVFTLQAYADAHGRHAAEVRRDLLPRAELRDAKKEGTVAAIEKFIASHQGSIVEADAQIALASALHKEFQKRDTVTELRDFIKTWPAAADVPAANARIHGLYANTLADFRQHANPDEPNAVPVVEAVIAYMEAKGSPPLDVRFRRRTSTSLAAADKLLAAGLLDDSGPAKGGRAEVSGHFNAKESKPREEAVVRALETGFRQIFPADILSLELGDPLPDDAPAPAAKTKPGKKPAPIQLPSVDAPTVFVDYEVSWSGSTYIGKDSGRRFVGIAVRFDVSVRVPNESRVLEFSLRVQPPEHFTVDYSKWDPNFASVMGKSRRAAKTDDDPGGPSDTVVYDVMALRAFDQMSTKLKGVFFDPATAIARGGVVAPSAKKAPAKTDDDDDTDD